MGPEFSAVMNTNKASRKAWLKERRKGLGGSDLGKLLFPNQYGGPLSLYLEKVSDTEPDDQGNENTDFGIIVEPAIREVYLPTSFIKMGISRRHFRIYRSPFLYRSNDRPWEMANIDALIEFLVPVEINGVQIPAGFIGGEFKTANFSQMEYWSDNQIPDSYYAQVQWYMGVLGLQFFLVLVLLDRTPEIRIVARDDDFINSMRAVASTFWLENVEKEEPPAATGGDLDALIEMYPKNEFDSVAEIPDLEQAMERYFNLNQQMSRLEDAQAELEAEIKQAIGHYAAAKSQSYQAVWSRWENERFDTKKFREDHPEIIEQYLRKSIGQRMVVKKLGIRI